MSNKIIVLKDGYIPDKSIFSEKGKTLILTTEKETVPVAVLGFIKGDFEMIYAGAGSEAEYAFRLGAIHALDKTARLFTNDKVLSGLFDEKTARSARPSKPRADKMAPMQDDEDLIKAPAPKKDKTSEDTPKAKESVQKKTAKQAGEPAPKKPVAKLKPSFEASMNPPKAAELSKISKKDVETLLKKNGYDTKYADTVVSALKDATPVTADLLVRTRLSLLEPDKDICFNIGELIKKNFC
ncbi:MAG: hypothetical protein J6I68_08370 [Butyrivibrio sp.]|uniref:hypothetical protein n=1 Tax=Butyrivibrio sp. TaxID=28121 RepID=UPI001B5FE3A0|nr:hypothetical protein [Butyrivibrio sp.]MBP3783245.1 hypothetical protein [Butyrivibrio sp.]